MTRLRITVLKCDTPAQAVVDEQGDYGVIYESFLRRSLAAYVEAGGREDVDAQITNSDMVAMGDLPPLDQVDCLVLTGSSEWKAIPPPSPRECPRRWLTWHGDRARRVCRRRVDRPPG